MISSDLYEGDLPMVSIVQLWSDSFTLAWTVEIPVNWFRVQYRDVSTGVWKLEPIVSGNQLLYVVQGLQNQTLYEFRVGMQRARDDSSVYTIPDTIRTCIRGHGSPSDCGVGKF